MSEKLPYVFYGRRVKRDWASVEHLLGKQTDASIARKLGCHQRTVSYIRKQLGIPQFRIADKIRHRLGRVPDTVVAEEFGIDRNTVLKARRDEGIPPCSRVKMVRLLRARKLAAAESEEDQQ